MEKIGGGGAIILNVDIAHRLFKKISKEEKFMKKKLLSIILAIMIILTAIPFSGITSSALYGFTYTYNDAKTGVTITNYSGGNTVVEIPAEVSGIPVVAIGNSAFKNRTTVEEVIIPDTVTLIGAHAFDNTALYNNHFKNYPMEPLYVDGHLIVCKNTYTSGEVVIPGGTKTIADEAFMGVTNLKSVIIPVSLVTIGTFAFKNCTNLTNISIMNDGIKRIGIDAFYNTGYFNNSANWTGDALYVGKHLVDTKTMEVETFTLKTGTVSIADGALSYNKMTNLVLGDKIERIGIEAFRGCTNLTSISFGSSLRSIDTNAFTACDNLQTLNFSGGDADWFKIVFDNLDANPMVFATEELFNGLQVGRVEIQAEDGITSIPAFSMYGCDTMTELYIQDGVTVINDKAFENCSSLNNVVLPSTLETVKNDVFLNSTLIGAVEYKGTPDQWVGINFYDANSNPVTYAKALSFNDTMAENIVIGEAVTKINQFAFNNCETLKTLELKLPLKTVSNSSFNGCVNLTDVYYDGTEEEWAKVSIAENNEPLVNATKHCYIPPKDPAEDYNYTIKSDWTVAITGYKGTDAQVTIPETLKGYVVNEIANSAFNNNDVITDIVIPDTVTLVDVGAFAYCSNLVSVQLPAGLSKISENTFSRCEKLTTVNIPDGCKSIGDEAFSYCSALESIVIPDGCESIGYNAFAYDYALSSVSLPDTLTFIGYEAFWETGIFEDEAYWDDCAFYIDNYLIYADNLQTGSYTIKDGTILIAEGAFETSNLTEVVFPESLRIVNDAAFYASESLKSVVMNEGLEVICAQAFYECTALDNVVIPNSIIAILSETFYGCSALKNITLSENLVVMGTYAFSGCRELESISIPEGVEEIQDRAFQDCASLKTAYLPSTIEKIGTNAFIRTSALTDVFYNGTTTEWANVGFKFLEGVTVHCLGGDDTPIIPENGTISVGSTQVKVGETITLPITVQNVQLGTLSYTIAYDSTKLKLVAIEDIPYDMYDTNTATPGKIVVVATNNEGGVTGVVANLTFEVIATTDCKTNVAITVKEAYNAKDVAVNMNAVSGTVEAITYTIGDPSGDGEITAIDARWVLQAAAGNKTLTDREKKAADVNGDGEVTAIDARWILQIAAGTRTL